jgi:hypothetical protein
MGLNLSNQQIAQELDLNKDVAQKIYWRKSWLPSVTN